MNMMEHTTTLPTAAASSADFESADRYNIERRGVLTGRVVGSLIAVIGAALASGGLWLLALGGSPYYLLSGIAYAMSGALLWRRRPAGAWLTVALLGATVCWALWEAGLNYWALFPRVLLPAGLALLAMLAALRFPANRSRRVTARAAGGLAVLLTVEFAYAFVPHGVLHSGLSRPFVSAQKPEEPSDWSSYGRTTKGTRYSPFLEINPANVKQLKPVWTYHSGDAGPGSLQDTPLQIRSFIYTCSRNNHIAALDADTGAVRWRYDSGVEPADWAHCRGVAYYELLDAPRDGTTARVCARRIFTSTVDARLIALDASTGQPCADFGRNGVVDLKDGLGPVKPGFYFLASAPVVARGRIIIGAPCPITWKLNRLPA